MPAAQAPLPRSLEPLPDESLPGFLLRLTHRLDLTPHQLARRVTLIPPDDPHARVSAAHLLMMEPARLHAFAGVTRMTTADADALTLRSHADRYPALAQALVRPGSIPRPRRLSQPWLLMNHSRYCPACLAGDGTPIQAAHGGPWKRQWRLAVTFACLDHWTFLRSECPRCRQPALSGRSGGPLTLLPAANAPRLHPAQCRNWSGRREVCGHRLDGAEPAAAALTPELADLQTVLLDLLESDEPAELVSQRFANLQVAISLIQAGWPVAAELAPAATRAILEAHLAPQQNDGGGPGPAAESTGFPPEAVWSAPPGDSIATAGLLFAAYHLLAQDASDPRSPLPQLLRSLPTRDDLRWGRTWPMLAHQASPSLRRRIDQVYRHRLSADWIRQGAPTLRASKANTTKKVFAPTNTLTDLGIAPEYIPQCLPGSWLLAATLKDSERDLTSYRLRRVLPVHLVQAISSMNFLEAAAFLGIPTSWTTQNRLRIKSLDPRRDLQNGDLPATLRLLAHQVLGQERVDYRSRRMQFSRWSIDDRTWDELCRQRPPGRGRKPNEHTRECASAFVWSYITGSEFALAPVFQPPMRPHDRTLSLDMPHLTKLRRWESKEPPIPASWLCTALEEYARQVIATVSHTS
ncbi:MULTISPECIES: TniQ family protein [unclassified Streptomyces]|uniref:TniQ family protein n=1 Tax=unclassified Streptomyces TaxID=2593676 RepID=UPI003822B2BD